MLPVIYYFLLLPSHSFLGARAVPTALGPNSLSLNPIVASNLSTAPFLFDEKTLDSLALLLNSSDVGEIEFFRVPNTHTILRIALQDTVIAKSNLARTILRTQQSLSTFIRDHDAEDEPLARGDDPYESSPRYPNCFFGVATWPIDSHHLTYGIVMNILQGLWLYLYRENRFLMALFEVRDDQFGTVGIGKITPERPPDIKD